MFRCRKVLRTLHAPGIAPEFVLLGVGDLDAKLGTVAEIFLDHIAQIMQVDAYLGKTMLFQVMDNMFDHGPIDDGNHRLGNCAGQRV